MPGWDCLQSEHSCGRGRLYHRDPAIYASPAQHKNWRTHRRRYQNLCRVGTYRPGQSSEPMLVRGPSLMTALPVEVAVTSQEIAHCLDQIPCKDRNRRIVRTGTDASRALFRYRAEGIFLTGGGALLGVWTKELQDKINIHFHISEGPLHSGPEARE